MRIPNEVIDRIVQSADIVATISEFVTLKKAGVNYKCICPFHEDKDASLVVSTKQKKYGNVSDAVKEATLSRLSRRANRYHSRRR